MSNLIEIAKGFTNLLKNKLHISKKEVEELAQKRMDVCMECPLRNSYTNTCNACGCYLPAKTRNLTQKCPKNKWKEV